MAGQEIISAYGEAGNFPDDEVCSTSCGLCRKTNVVLISMYFIQDIDIVATYSDTSGAIRLGRVKMKDLSASWMWDNPVDGNHGRQRNFQVLKCDNLLVELVNSLLISGLAICLA